MGARQTLRSYVSPFDHQPSWKERLARPPPEALDHRALRGQVRLARAEGDKQRGEVLGARVGGAGGRGLTGEVKQRVHVAVGQHPLAPVVELTRPLWHRALEDELPQVVREEPAAHDQHARIAQRGELRPRSINSRGSRVGMDSWMTGTSACGYISTSGTYAPWSRPRSACSCTWPPSSLRTASASAGAPGAG